MRPRAEREEERGLPRRFGERRWPHHKLGGEKPGARWSRRRRVEGLKAVAARACGREMAGRTVDARRLWISMATGFLGSVDAAVQTRRKWVGVCVCMYVCVSSGRDELSQGDGSMQDVGVP